MAHRTQLLSALSWQPLLIDSIAVKLSCGKPTLCIVLCVELAKLPTSAVGLRERISIKEECVNLHMNLKTE